MNRKKWLGLSGLVVLLLGLGVLVVRNELQLDATAPVSAKHGVAIDGYDAVAYFLQSRPVEGNAEFTQEWNGA
ncbi:MAG: hypothetical protein ACRDRT_18340, partial [Pseudonocardiaceae bacterium]